MAQATSAYKSQLIELAHSRSLTDQSFLNFLGHLVDSIEDGDLKNKDLSDLLDATIRAYEHLGATRHPTPSYFQLGT